MISTVTVSTITTITTITAMGLAATVSGVAVVALISFLTTKELASTANSSSMRYIGRFLTIAIPPLVIVFGVIIALKVAEVLA